MQYIHYRNTVHAIQYIIYTCTQQDKTQHGKTRYNNTKPLHYIMLDDVTLRYITSHWIFSTLHKSWIWSAKKHHIPSSAKKLMALDFSGCLKRSSAPCLSGGLWAQKLRKHRVPWRSSSRITRVPSWIEQIHVVKILSNKSVRHLHQSSALSTQLFLHWMLVHGVKPSPGSSMPGHS